MATLIQCNQSKEKIPFFLIVFILVAPVNFMLISGVDCLRIYIFDHFEVKSNLCSIRFDSERGLDQFKELSTERWLSEGLHS